MINLLSTADENTESAQTVRVLSPLISSFPAPASVTLLDAIEKLSHSMDATKSQASADQQFVITVTTFAGVTFSVGAALWLLQSRLLLAAALAALPLWRSIDPVPVLIYEGTQDHENDSLGPTSEMTETPHKSGYGNHA